MTCFVPDDIQRQLAARAEELQTTTEALVVEALTHYLGQAAPERQEAIHGEEAVRGFRQLQQAAAMNPQSAASRKNAILKGRR
jgi:hypothetical protein